MEFLLDQNVFYGINT